MLYLELRHVQAIIRKLNRKYNTGIDIINRGQLEFALEKPKMNFYGQEQYPQLYQKAAVLMEALTKMHTLSDGNKRTAMLVAEMMIDANGGHLVLPLKSIRLSVDTAMDEDDKMSDVIKQWFKVHTATDACSLSAMLAELDAEEDTILDLLGQGREGDANSLLDKWVAFDNYPDNREACNELIARWKRTQEMAAAVKHASAQKMHTWSSAWSSLLNARDLPHSMYYLPTEHHKDMYRPPYRSNSMAELLSAEEQINREVDMCRNAVDEIHVFQSAARLERYGMYYHAIKMFEQFDDMDIDTTDMEFRITVNIRRGMAYFGVGQHDKTIEFCKRALLLDPNNLHVLGLMGISYAEMGKNRRALECFDRLIAIKPNYKGYYYKGTVLANLGKYEDAIANYTKDIEINPDHTDSRINLAAVMLDSGRAGEAIPHLLHALTVDPDDPIALSNMVDALTRMKRYDEALIHADKIIILNPSDTDAKYQKAHILLDLGRRNECLKVLESLAKADPEFNKAINSDAFKEEFGPIMQDKRFKNIT